MDMIEQKLNALGPDCVVADSIQTMYRPEMASAPGSVSQVRECASLLMRYAKTTGCPVFLVGHVTRKAAIAGLRVLEHGGCGDALKAITSAVYCVRSKIAGSVTSWAFEMTGQGMVRCPTPPGAAGPRATNISGSAVFCGMEHAPGAGRHQALAAQSFYPSPSAVNGMDQGRIAIAGSAGKKRGVSCTTRMCTSTWPEVSLLEPAADLAVCCGDLLF